jgi:hypothetical protein
MYWCMVYAWTDRDANPAFAKKYDSSADAISVAASLVMGDPDSQYAESSVEFYVADGDTIVDHGTLGRYHFSEYM